MGSANVWTIRTMDAGSQGLEFATARIDSTCRTVLVHDPPDSMRVEVSLNGADLVGSGTDLSGGEGPVPTTGEADGVGRLPEDVEAAIYFCLLEALQNVAKYADARSATVRLRAGLDAVEFEIADDGCGFDPASAERGSGIQGMVDRIDAIGGTLAGVLRHHKGAPGRDRTCDKRFRKQPRFNT